MGSSLALSIASSLSTLVSSDESVSWAPPIHRIASLLSFRYHRSILVGPVGSAIVLCTLSRYVSIFLVSLSTLKKSKYIVESCRERTVNDKV